MRMVKCVPEGGNWKDIPTTIPSKRLEQIRESFKRGEGSRSTYYGRLRRCDPAYTINTYFSRPGNGCHIHYDQDRVLSPREASRLQGFPDSFEFLGSQGAISTQIGNAVPPLLAYQIAKSLGSPGVFIDLFSGAGGMGLGFKWAGWKPVVANDIHPTYLSTYARNVHDNVLVGSIASKEIFEKLLDAAKIARLDGGPFWVLGGPPCQGFSTAGKQRSMEDPRNHLAWDYVRFLHEAKPDGFVFENVTGLLNMEGGRVFANLREAFSSAMPSIIPSVLSTVQYAIPQRRKRVILVGTRMSHLLEWLPPAPVTSMRSGSAMLASLPNAISVQDALDDLPMLLPGQDGRSLLYRSDPRTPYQSFMRGRISAEEYLRRVGNTILQS
ncbi:DNA (cytosine-5-)-methyltransferase [Geothrix alkalitolerans]|uniref:DNA (cytosine-5-)-methyltransferase n=1 Tax=Geothrix alkalitolerans TaxID=2922724 RepID=UPI001FAF6324|nr:DNA (cytosine-5-)-methyltransferase [Geothrix alkalitolerans]